VLSHKANKISLNAFFAITYMLVGAIMIIAIIGEIKQDPMKINSKIKLFVPDFDDMHIPTGLFNN
jgi:hypothetical protein